MFISILDTVGLTDSVSLARTIRVLLQDNVGITDVLTTLTEETLNKICRNFGVTLEFPTTRATLGSPDDDCD